MTEIKTFHVTIKDIETSYYNWRTGDAESLIATMMRARGYTPVSIEDDWDTMGWIVKVKA